MKLNVPGGWIAAVVSIILSSGGVLGQDARIVGGFDVNPEFKYPWMVAIYRYGEYWCGGIRLAQNKVITAGHCMGGVKGPLRNFEVQVHRHNLDRTLAQEGATAFSVTKRWLATGYDQDALYNDLAIIELNTTNSARTSMVIDTSLGHREGYRVSALGWGALGLQQANHPILQEVWLPLVSPKSCAASYRKQLNYTILPSQICAGFSQGGKDACQGDSGGPLFTYINDRPVLVGVTSNGYMCAQPKTPGIYTRIGFYHDWIQGILQGTIPPTPDQDYDLPPIESS